MAPAWLNRLVEQLRVGRPAARPSEQERRIERVLLRWAERRPHVSEVGTLVNTLEEALPAGEPVEAGTLVRVAAHLRGHAGEELEQAGADLAGLGRFWRRLFDRGAGPLARACHAETLLVSGDVAEAAAELLDALEEDPGLLDFREDLYELARDQGGEVWLRYRLVCLRVALSDRGHRDGPDDDLVRELYGELLDQYSDDPVAVNRIRVVGRLIDEAVARGDLPRALVRRTRRRDVI